jgi:hypothetical protein
MPLEQAEDLNLVLLYQVSVDVVCSVFDLSSFGCLGYHHLEVFFVQLEKLLVEDYLLLNHPGAQLLTYLDLSLFTYLGDEEDERVLDGFNL